MPLGPVRNLLSSVLGRTYGAVCYQTAREEGSAGEAAGCCSPPGNQHGGSLTREKAARAASQWAHQNWEAQPFPPGVCLHPLWQHPLWQPARKNLKGPNPPSFTDQAKKVNLELSGTKLIIDTFYPLDNSASICTLTHIEFPYKNSKETIFLPNKNSYSYKGTIFPTFPKWDAQSCICWWLYWLLKFSHSPTEYSVT